MQAKHHHLLRPAPRARGARLAMPVLFTAAALALGIRAFLSLPGASQRLPMPAVPSAAERAPRDPPDTASVGIETRLRIALSQPDASARRRAFARLGALLRPEDFPAALAACRAIEESDVRAEASGHVWGAWAALAPADALEFFVREDSPEHRAALLPLAEALLKTDPRETVTWLENSPAHMVREELFNVFFERWSAESMTEAATAALTWNESPRLAHAALGFLSEWLRVESAEPIRLVESLVPGPFKDEAELELIKATASDQPLAAAQRAMRLPAGPTREKCLALALDGWMRSGPEGADEAARWIASLAGPLKDTAAAIYAGLGPEKYAASWVRLAARP